MELASTDRRNWPEKQGLISYAFGRGRTWCADLLPLREVDPVTTVSALREG